MAAGKQPSHRKRGRHHGDEDDDYDDGTVRSPPTLTSETGRIGFDFAVVCSIFDVDFSAGEGWRAWQGRGGGEGGRSSGRRARDTSSAGPIERR